MIDLDAIIGEAADKTLKFKGKEFTLPGELPGACIAPFLAPDLGLTEIIADLIAADDKADDEDGDGWLTTLIDTLVKRPNLPVQLLEAAKTALNELLDYTPGGAAEFHALKPSVNAYAALAVGIAKDYGMDLADFFSSDESSDSDGEDSNTTSNAGADSTPAESGDAPEPTDS